MRRLRTKAGLLAGVTVLMSPLALAAADEAPAGASPPPAAAPAPGDAAQAPESGEAAPSPETEDTTAAAEDSTGIQEIVITAQKRSENLQDVPLAVTALTADDLAASN